MSYATARDMQDRFDWEELGDLCSIGAGEQVSANDQVTNQKMVTALLDASGDIDSALMVMGQYTATDLAGITDANSLAKLKRVCCEIALAYLFENRPLFNPERMKAYQDLKEGHLEKIRKGINVFNIVGQAQIEAGTPEASGLTCVQYNSSNLNLATDPSRMHYYPARQLPFGRGGS